MRGRGSPWSELGRVVLLILLVPGLENCAASNIQDRNVSHAPSTKERAADVVDRPWYDLNLSKTMIPPLLIQASAAPYAPPSETGCAGLMLEIDGRNKILGPDLPPTIIHKRGSSLSKKAAGDTSWGVARGF